jgi:hypothetical protein
MTVKKTTHDQLAATLTQEWKKPVMNKQPTTHQVTTERFTEQYREAETAEQLADILTSTK